VNYNVVVFTELHPMYFIDKIDKACREKEIQLIYGMCLGLADMSLQISELNIS